MKIGLLAADSHNFPNLPLMKASAYYKARGGYEVEWWSKEGQYDAVLCSVIFSHTEKPIIENAKEVIYGGSGISLNNYLPPAIEHTTPDYSLYPDCDFALGFLTRGCPRTNHKFCITPQKDGCKSIKTANLSEFWTGQKKIVLLDQNILACTDSRMELLQQLAKSEAEVEFNGGMDARYVNEEIAAELRKIKVKDYHFAWDDPKEQLEGKFEFIAKSGIKNPDRVGVYVLTNYWSTTEQDLYRVYALRKLGFVPYVMIYNKMEFVDKNGRWLPDVEKRFTIEELRHFKICQFMQRWAGNRKLIKTIPDFRKYDQYEKMLSGDRGWLPKSIKNEGSGTHDRV